MARSCIERKSAQRQPQGPIWMAAIRARGGLVAAVFRPPSIGSATPMASAAADAATKLLRLARHLLSTLLLLRRCGRLWRWCNVHHAKSGVRRIRSAVLRFPIRRTIGASPKCFAGAVGSDYPLRHVSAEIEHQFLAFI